MGYYRYYGITDNTNSIRSFYETTAKMYYKIINRRSQKNRYSYEGYYEKIQKQILTPTYGVQIITMETADYVDQLTLGEYSNNTITSKSMNDYNDVINILNNATSKYLNTDYAESVRSVGSVPDNPSYDTTEMFTSTYSYMSSYNGKFKYVDFFEFNYDESDLSQLRKLEIINIGVFYWYAGRCLFCHEDDCIFGIRNISSDGDYNYFDLCYIDSSGVVRSYSYKLGIRPVFTLKSGIKVIGGSGTAENPYTLGP